MIVFKLTNFNISFNKCFGNFLLYKINQRSSEMFLSNNLPKFVINTILIEDKTFLLLDFIIFHINR